MDFDENIPAMVDELHHAISKQLNESRSVPNSKVFHTLEHFGIRCQTVREARRRWRTLLGDILMAITPFHAQITAAQRHAEEEEYDDNAAELEEELRRHHLAGGGGNPMMYQPMPHMMQQVMPNVLQNMTGNPDFLNAIYNMARTIMQANGHAPTAAATTTSPEEQAPPPQTTTAPPPDAFPQFMQSVMTSPVFSQMMSTTVNGASTSSVNRNPDQGSNSNQGPGVDQVD